VNKTIKNNSFFLILLAAILGSGVGVLAKIGLREIQPITFTFLRFVAALIILIPFFYSQRQKLSISDFKKLFLVSLFGAGNIFIFIYGIRLTNASASQVIYTLSPLITGILSYFFFGEKLGSRKIWGVIIGFIGTLFVVLLPVLTGRSGINGSIGGNLLILLAVCSHSFYSMLSKEKQKEFSPITMTMYFVITTFLISAILLPFSHPALFQLPSAGAILSVLYAGLLGTGGFYLIYQYAIKHSSAVVASTVLYLEPIFTFIWAAGLLGEKLTVGLIIGTALVFVGVYLASTKNKIK